MIRRKATILKAIKENLHKHLGDRLIHIILFGSRAWGKARPDSDYDLLIVVNKDNDWRLRDEISEILYEIDLMYNIVTQPLVISENEILHSFRGKQPIIQNALYKGIYV